MLAFFHPGEWFIFMLYIFCLVPVRHLPMPSLLGQCISVTYPTRTACRKVYVVGRKRAKIFSQNH